jgi:glycosyltransferase involved in cell wall biosynthesis
MPSYNEENYIEECLNSLLKQNYPADRIEILLADGGSTDRTREIVVRIAATTPRVRLLDNAAHRIQSYGMNLAIKESKGDFVLIVDVHAEYANNYVSKLIEVFERTGADAAGGAARAKFHTAFQKALCAALDSPLGVGGAAYRSAEKEGWVDTVFPGAFRRSTLEKVGLYDTNAITNEDAELFQRILQANGRVYLSRDVVVHYYPRKSLSLLAKQYFKYGDGRARTFLIHKRFPVIRPLVPFFSLLAGAALLLVPPFRSLAPYGFGVYIICTAVEAVRGGIRSRSWAIPVIWIIFPVMHVSHGLGMLQGLVKYLIKPRPTRIDRLASSAFDN